jgi:hypothetical protein
MQRLCFIHAGLHRTGTTSLQAVLALNEGGFRERGLYVPATGRLWAQYAGHHNVAWELIGWEKFDPALGTLEGLSAELAACGYPSACISSEDFEFLHNRPQDMRRLNDAIRSAGYEPRIVMYVRPQVEYCESAYAKIREQGFDLDFTSYVAEVLREGTSSGILFDYDALLARFAAVFGAATLIPRAFLPSPDGVALIGDFMHVLSPNGISGDFTLRVPGRLNARSDAHVRTLDEATKHMMQERFTASNKRVAERFGITIPVS